MGRGSKKSASRPVATAESFLDDALDFLQYDAIPFIARGSGYAPAQAYTGAGTPPITITSGNQLNALQSAAGIRAVDLLKDNRELINTNFVMLPSGKVIERPAGSLTQQEAIQRVYDDMSMGRTPDPYEKAVATGDIVSRYKQEDAQKELRNRMSEEMVKNTTYDAVPILDQDLLRRAAGMSSGDVSAAKVEIKAKQFDPNKRNDNKGGGGGGFKGTSEYGDMIRKIPKNSDLSNRVKSIMGDVKDSKQAIDKLRELRDKSNSEDQRYIDDAISALKK